MNRACAFAVGVVVAGVGATLFAGNPNPPAGPIGPTMVTLDQIAGMVEYQQRLLALGLREWDSTAVAWTPGVPPAFVGSGVVRSVYVSAGTGNGMLRFYDSESAADKSKPIASVYVGSCCGSPQNAALQLDVRVTKGLWIDLPNGSEATVVFRRDDTP